MSDTPHGDLVSNHPRATLLTTFTAVLVALAQEAKDEDWRKICVPLAPFLALILMMVLKTVFNKDKCKELIKIHHGWISDLEKEKLDEETTLGRKKEIAKEIAKYKAEIKKLQTDSISVKFN